MPTVASVIQRILEPLSENTSKLLEPSDIRSNDRLRVALTEDGRHFVLHAYAELNDVRVTPSHPARAGRWIQNMPEVREVTANRWEVAATDISALIINASWLDSQLIFDDQSRVMYQFLLTRFLSQTFNSQTRAEFKIEHREPTLPADWFDHPDRPLAKYQRVACVTTLGQDCAALFMEQGTGKTAVAIRRICIEARRKRMAKAGQPYRVLIVSPKNVRFNWLSELEVFGTVPGRAAVLRGSAASRLSTWAETITIDGPEEFCAVVCSYESFVRDWPFLGSVKWDLCILDEAHAIKNVYAKRAKHAVVARDGFEARLILTGTPITNSILDLYIPLEFLGEGMSGFSNYKSFKKFYTQFEKDDRYERTTGFQNLPFLQERLARIAMMITKKEALPDLPEKLYEVREVVMTAKQRNWYIQLQDQLALEIEAGTNRDGKKMTAQHILTKLLRLAQITSGFATWDAEMNEDTGEIRNPKAIEFVDPNPKLEELVKIIGELDPNEKAIVWACFIPDVYEIEKRLAAMGIKCCTFTGSTNDEDRAAAESNFNNLPASEMKVFIGNPAAGGAGLNLRGYNPATEGTPEDHGSNCTRVVYYSQNWSMVHRAQSEDRAHRRGTRVPVTYIDLCVPGTIDEEIRGRVVGKRVDAASIQDVREIMNRVLSVRPFDETSEGNDDDE